MYTILLVIIYIAFISLGLPDSLLGSAWPVMHKELGVPLSYAGIVTMIIAGGLQGKIRKCGSLAAVAMKDLCQLTIDFF